MKQYLDKFQKLHISSQLSLFIAAVLFFTIGITINNALTRQEGKTRAASNSISTNSSVAVSNADCPEVVSSVIPDWCDGFNGSSIDKNKWTNTDFGCWDSWDKTKAANNTEVSGGKIRLKLTAGGQPTNCGNKEPYTGFGFESQGKHDLQYGCWQAKTKFSTAGDKRVTGYLALYPLSGWPPEIDYFETSGVPGDANKVFFTQHWGVDNGNGHPSQRDSVFFDITQFHTYAVEVTNSKIKWYVDGNLKTTQVNNSPGTKWLVTQGLWACGWENGGNTCAGIVTPQYMDIDYLAIWDNKPCSSIGIKSSPTVPNPSPSLTIAPSPTPRPVSRYVTPTIYCLGGRPCTSPGPTQTPIPTQILPSISLIPSPTITPTPSSTPSISFSQDLKFVTIGDPHIDTNVSANSTILTHAVNYINKNMTDIDFVVVLGDIVDFANDSSFKAAKDILDTLCKPYYVVMGNHEGYANKTMFENYFGSMDHINKRTVLRCIGKLQSFRKKYVEDQVISGLRMSFSTAHLTKPAVFFAPDLASKLAR